MILAGSFRRCVFLIFALLSASGCATIERPPDVPSDWVLVSADNRYALWAPRGTRYRRGPPFDSWVGNFSHPEFTIYMDYGIYAPDFRRLRELFPSRTETVTIDGKEAIIAQYPNRKEDGCEGTTVEVNILNVDTLSFTDDPAEITLWLYACVQDDDTAVTLRRIYRTVLFLPRMTTWSEVLARKPGTGP